MLTKRQAWPAMVSVADRIIFVGYKPKSPPQAFATRSVIFCYTILAILIAALIILFSKLC
jgi:hypothetical protein